MPVRKLNDAAECWTFNEWGRHQTAKRFSQIHEIKEFFSKYKGDIYTNPQAKTGVS